MPKISYFWTLSKMAKKPRGRSCPQPFNYSLIHHGRVHKTCNSNISNIAKVCIRAKWLIRPKLIPISVTWIEKPKETACLFISVSVHIYQFPGQSLPVRGCQDLDRLHPRLVLKPFLQKTYRLIGYLFCLSTVINYSTIFFRNQWRHGKPWKCLAGSCWNDACETCGYLLHYTLNSYWVFLAAHSVPPSPLNKSLLRRF